MYRPRRTALPDQGFTIVELLITIAIIGVLASLVLPAIQQAREAARRITCQNNLKQIAVAALNHEQMLGHFPYGGWGYRWVGVPSRGAREHQPGGWVYNLLPYLEQRQLHRLGDDPSSPTADEEYARRLGTPLPLFTCPTRRVCQAWPFDGTLPLPFETWSPRPAGTLTVAARSDYAINTAHRVSIHHGPDDLQDADNTAGVARDFVGISHVRKGAKPSRIVDGLSNTYLVAEKFLDPNHYTDGKSVGDSSTLYSGYCYDLHRFTSIDLTPLLDKPVTLTDRGYWRFGSAHPAGFHAAMCDGSVKTISYEIEPELHFRHGHRSDQGRPIVNGEIPD